MPWLSSHVRLLCLAKCNKRVLHFLLVKSRSIVKNGKILKLQTYMMDTIAQGYHIKC